MMSSSAEQVGKGAEATVSWAWGRGIHAAEFLSCILVVESEYVLGKEVW